MAARYQAEIETPHRPRTCFQARIPGDANKDLVARVRRETAAAERAGFRHRPVPVLVPTPRKD